MTETNRIELKRELTPEVDIEKEIVAFLNYKEGGILYIGIESNGNVIGVKDVDGDMLKVKDRIKHNIMPSAMGLFDVTEKEINGRSVIKVFVASGSEKPYFKKKYGMTDRGCFTYFNKDNQRQTINETLREIASEAGIQKHISFNSARRTFATLASAKGISLMELKAYMGHSSSKTTERYIKWSVNLAAKSAKRLALFTVKERLKY